jgi:hypothetical protein
MPQAGKNANLSILNGRALRQFIRHRRGFSFAARRAISASLPLPYKPK